MSRFIAGLVVITALCVTTPAAADAERYVVDKAHSSILFFVNHLGFSRMIGEFHDFDVTMMFDEDNMENSEVEVVIRTASVDTDVDELDNKLIEPAHMNAEKFPEARFISTEVRPVDENRMEVLGDLTLFGETRPMILDVTLNGTGVNPFSGKPTAGFRVESSLLRSNYGFNSWIPGVGDEVEFLIEMELMRAG